MLNTSQSNSTLSMLDNSTTAPQQTVWLLHPDLHQVTLGLAWSLLCIIGLLVNSFICVYTVIYMCQKKTSTRIAAIYTSQSSLLLFNLSLGFVLESLVGLPFVATATASGEWMIGLSDDVKRVTCAVSGFALHWGYSVSLHSLAVISVERFLFISKPHIHRTKFTNKVILIIIVAIWIYCLVLSTTPYYGLGGYVFYRQGGICIAPLPPENWWLIVYIVYSTIPILLLMAMIMATFTFAMRFAKRQRRSVRAPSSVSHTGGNYHTSVGRTASAPEMDSHGPGQGVSKATTEKTGKREQIKLCCCCFSGRRCFTLYGVFGALVGIYSIQLVTGTISSIITIPTGIDFQPAELQATSTYLTTALPLLTGIIQVYFRPEFRKLLTWIAKKFTCRKLSKHPWDSTLHPQRSHASFAQANREREGGLFPASTFTNCDKAAVTGSTMVSHSRSASALADISKDKHQREQQTVNETDAVESKDDTERSAKVMFADQTPKRIIRFFSEVAKREDSAVTITDEDPASP